jgi:LuxR family transcriptional regulator, maltose regulon positive regulatory protein
MTKPSNQLLNPKISTPPVQKSVILRPDLIARLNNADMKGGILVSAPAGYGKTCLINSWVRNQTALVAWFTLDETDNNLSHFFSYLLSSIQIGCPGIEIDEELFQFDDAPSETKLFSLIYYLLENINGLILVLDDYHNIHNPIIHRFVQQIINIRNSQQINNQSGITGILPVILTRTDPPFPLSRWRIQNEIIEIRADDLIFTIQEGEQFFAQSAITNLSEDQIESILSKTEGWIAGLQLAAISFHEQYQNDVQQFMKGFNGCNPLIADYLMNEVVSSLPDQLQKFLYETSILEIMSGSLCDEITGDQKSQEILELLEKSNLFVINLDHKKNWYRYHHLFADFLIKKSNQSDGEKLLIRHSLAGKWFEEHEFYEESITHYISARQVDQAVRVITDVASPLLAVGKTNNLKKLLDLFQEPEFSIWPWLSIYRGWLCVILESGFEDYWLEKAEKAINQNSGNLIYSSVDIEIMKWNILAIRLFGAAKKGEIASAQGYIAEAHNLEPDKNKFTHGILNYAKGMCSFISGDLVQSVEYLTRSKKEFLSGRTLSTAGEVIGLIGETDYIRGHLFNAAKTYREAISLQKLEEHEIPSLSRSFSGLGQVLFEWNHIEEALTYMIKGYHYGKSCGTSAQIFSGMVLAGTYINISELDNAREILDEIEDLPRYRELQPCVVSLWISCRIRYFCAIKDIRRAQRLIDNRNIQKIENNDTVRAPERMALIRYFLTINEPDLVITLTDQIAANMEKRGRIGKLIRLLINQAVAYNLRGNHELAIKDIIKALELGKSDGFIQRFVDYDYTILPDLVEISQMDRKYLPPSFDMEYVKEIIQVLYRQELGKQSYDSLAQKSKTIAKSSQVPLLEYPLTLQEDKILQLLISGYDNFQIAAIQHITINTVKSHISHIFNKLGVHNRVQAANRAKILGLAR